MEEEQRQGAGTEASKPREVIQMDTIDFGELFAFTAIDIFSKEADILPGSRADGQIWV